MIVGAEHIRLPAGHGHHHPLRGSIVQEIGGGDVPSVMETKIGDSSQSEAGFPSLFEVPERKERIPFHPVEQIGAGGREGPWRKETIP